MRYLVVVPLIALFFGCGGGGGSPPANPEPEPDLGIVYVVNNGDICWDCLEIHTNGVLTEQFCGADPICPGETADAVVERGNYYNVRLWTSDGLWVVDFPSFFFDTETHTLTIGP